jgi:hypothetical protein
MPFGYFMGGLLYRRGLIATTPEEELAQEYRAEASAWRAGYGMALSSAALFFLARLIGSESEVRYLAMLLAAFSGVSWEYARKHRRAAELLHRYLAVLKRNPDERVTLSAITTEWPHAPRISEGKAVRSSLF